MRHELELRVPMIFAVRTEISGFLVYVKRKTVPTVW